MANRKEMFETGAIKLDFLTKGDEVFNAAISKIDKKEASEKNAELSKVVANQKGGSAK